MDEYYKEMEVPIDILGLATISMYILIGIIVIAFPNTGFIMGILLLFVGFLKIILLSKEHHIIFWTFILGISMAVMTGNWFGELILGLISIGIGIYIYLEENGW